MYQPMLFLHWKQIRFALLPFVLAAYALPLLSVQGLGAAPGMDGPSMEAYRVITTAEAWVVFFPLLAAGIGITLALSAWNWDHTLKHVYALSLPIPRWRYATLKMGAGAVLALLPAAAFWIGSHVAVASISLPAGLNAYPDQLALRFLAAILVAYAIVFAMAAGTTRTTLWLLCGWVAFLLLANPLAHLVTPMVGMREAFDLVEWSLEALVTAPGPFEVFNGNWTLIDV